MTDCVFCSIARRTVPAFIVHEDADVVAFMDKNPINSGHILVIPKFHEQHFQELSDDLYSKVALVAKRLAKAVDALYAPKKVGFAVAGFDVPHAHLHVIPMHDYHDLTSQHYLNGTLKKPSPDELKLAAEAIHKKLVEPGVAAERD